MKLFVKINVPHLRDFFVREAGGVYGGCTGFRLLLRVVIIGQLLGPRFNDSARSCVMERLESAKSLGPEDEVGSE